ncbi:MAG: tetratricopeptide repeat protein, partial [Candidatus Aminicenantales bacterium]
ETAAALEGRGVVLADVEKAFAGASADGLPGRELFLDHVHMTFDGSYLIARTLFDLIRDFLPEEATRGAVLTANLPGPEICAERLAFTEWDRHQVLDDMLEAYFRKPPFTNQLDNPQEVARKEGELAALRARLTPDVLRDASSRYERAIALSPRDWWLRWKYAQFLDMGLDQPREALGHYEAMTRLVPHSFLGYSGMGYIQQRLHDAEGAISSCLKALALAPGKAEVHNTLAAAYMIQGASGQAETHFLKAIALQPHYTVAYDNLALLYAKDGRLSEAVRVCRQGLAFEPESVELILALSRHLVQMGLRDEAIAEIRKAQQKNPRNEELNRGLNELLWEKVSRR